MSNPTRKNNKKRTIWIAAVFIAPVILLSIFLLLAFQVPQYSYYYVKCGFKQPVKGFKDINSSAPGRYTLPSDATYSDAGYLYGAKYYCTEQEAVSDGAEHYR